MTWHVYPTTDLYEHSTDGFGPCACCPTVEIMQNGDIMYTHNSWREREWEHATKHVLIMALGHEWQMCLN